VKKRILNIREQSRVNLSKENLWYFSESSHESQPSPMKNKSLGRDRLSILSEDLNRHDSLLNSERKSNKKECAFIVDWQL